LSGSTEVAPRYAKAMKRYEKQCKSMGSSFFK
jgi:hypothetical protein